MFSTVRYFIKTSLAFLILGLLTGVYMSLARNVFDWGFGDELVSAHTHVVLVGSVMMMIMGVALWFFPRPPQTTHGTIPTSLVPCIGLSPSRQQADLFFSSSLRMLKFEECDGG